MTADDAKFSRDRISRKDVFQDAYEMFGEMRPSTPEEQALMRQVYEKHAVVIPDGNIFELAEDSVKPTTLDFNMFDSADETDGDKLL